MDYNPQEVLILKLSAENQALQYQRKIDAEKIKGLEDRLAEIEKQGAPEPDAV